MNYNKITYTILVVLSISGLVLPLGIIAQVEPPQTVEEARGFGLEILRGLPRVVKELWQEQVLPLWQRMWNWFKSILQKLWNWFLGLLGREVERVRPEIEEKVEETKQSLWQRFKNLFK